MKSEYKGIQRILKAFTFSFDGFRAVFASEAAFRQDLLFCAVCGVVFCILPLETVARAFLFFALFLILFAELVNTAIEVIVDRIGTEYHPLAKKAKDIGSLLVLTAFVHFFAASAVILYPLFWGQNV
ncbi:MAG: diacylglycerol kinase [Alphaproteobacteria bacterium]|nr:diacylglycerol kinase [Alphaproteobacteria bacterium]